MSIASVLILALSTATQAQDAPSGWSPVPGVDGSTPATSASPTAAGGDVDAKIAAVVGSTLTMAASSVPSLAVDSSLTITAAPLPSNDQSLPVASGPSSAAADPPSPADPPSAFVPRPYFTRGNNTLPISVLRTTTVASINVLETTTIAVCGCETAVVSSAVISSAVPSTAAIPVIQQTESGVPQAPAESETCIEQSNEAAVPEIPALLFTVAVLAVCLV
ncbi:hypothetical protein TRVA0_004S03224 [Trichomonascus vanleenenianus]|uniref:uncharacterized protein n=1 Tax=Trichomonascus vanleenenianus TaxID=2268995 RepID=UPI003ECACFB8